MPTEEKRLLIERSCEISISRQCLLLGVARSSYYYRRTEANHADEADGGDAVLMRLLDEQYTRTPFYGVPRMTVWLQRLGHLVGPKRVRRLLRLMGLEAIYPKPRLSKPAPGHRIFPYLLRSAQIDKPDDVWATDITYVRMRHGFVYLTAVMDWWSRFVLAWKLSQTLETDFCVQALDAALQRGRPQIFNSDQGSQFTSDAFTGRLEREDIRISMDGRGRCMDNIFIERLWRTVKYEEVYLHDYESVWMAEDHLSRYFEFYNQERPHQSLDWHTPAELYFSGGEKSTLTRSESCLNRAAELSS
jgi:putative transposase